MEVIMSEKGWALISVSDKRGLPEFARGLSDLGYPLLASGGTAKVLRSAGLDVVEVSDVTGFPEILDGRVKTLHPAIHGGILARSTPEHMRELDSHRIRPVDVVVVNLYPFRETVSKEGVSESEAVEQIDIGGVALLRAAAKNFERVTVVCDPADYEDVLSQLRDGQTLEHRRALALKAFRHTASYDIAISGYLADQVGEGALPDVALASLRKAQTLRYGENPHQAAALYLPDGSSSAFVQLHGKEMSYNNWRDMDGAWNAVQDFSEPTVVITKHANPCGVASAPSLREAYEAALASDPISAFGSVIAVNRPLDFETAEAMKGLFIEVIVAPDYDPDALARLKRKSKNLRILKHTGEPLPQLLWRTTAAGVLINTPDRSIEPPDTWEVVTEREPTPEEMESLDFAWRVVKHVKSNAIVFARGKATVGVGAGQMSRVDAVRLAAMKAGGRSKGAVLASDAFFPFPDGVEEAAKAGVTAVVQPGGSKRDAEVIEAANRLGLAMVFTGVRHFLH
jgi:phosphoribosylaminoimidazolecarboxamide formyltransferase/IMP cyclohydrolase